LTAFVFFVRAYAVWIYLLCALGILVGVKMLTDARRLARTTLFSLEQERAGEQSYRALIVILVFFLAIAAVATVSVVGPAFVPTESPLVRGATPTLPAFIFPTNTPVPTATVTPFLPTETPFVTTVPITPTVTRTAKPITPVVSPTLTPSLPVPTITGPVPNGGTWTGEGRANVEITFRWNCDQCVLGPKDWYEVVIYYVDKSGAPRTIAGRTQDKFLSLRRIVDGGPFDIYQKAKEDTFQWYVQVKRDPGDQPVSPPSETWKFVWK
jgi:hypothetical protein